MSSGCSTSGMQRTLTSKPRAYAFTKSAPFWIAPMSLVCLDVWDLVSCYYGRIQADILTRISTHFRCTFMRTCNCSISVKGEKMFTQSFFSGVIRWGGMGIRRVSDFFPAAEACAAADIGGNTGMPEVEGISVGSVSIMSSSSSPCCDGISCDPDPEGPSSLAMSSSFSIGSLGSAVLGVFFIFLLVFFFATTCALDSAAATTIFREASNVREAGFIWGYAGEDQRSQVNSTVYA